MGTGQRHGVRRRWAGTLAAAIMVAALSTVSSTPSQATMGTCVGGVEVTTIPGDGCPGTVSVSPLLASCDPILTPTTSCSPGASVTITVSKFGPSNPVYVWWLNGEVDDPTAGDCTQAVLSNPPSTLAGTVTGRTSLVPGVPGTITTNAAGTATLSVTLPPAGGTPKVWSYGTNWICATLSSPGGAALTPGSGHTPFLITP